MEKRKISDLQVKVMIKSCHYENQLNIEQGKDKKSTYAPLHLVQSLPVNQMGIPHDDGASVTLQYTSEQTLPLSSK